MSHSTVKANRAQILDMHVYIGGHFLSKAEKGTVQNIGNHKRITNHYEAMRSADLVKSEIEQRKGRTLVSGKALFLLTPVSICSQNYSVHQAPNDEGNYGAGLLYVG